MREKKLSSGSVLLAVIIGLGVLTTVIIITTKRNKDQISALHFSSIEGDKEVFRQMLINRTSCSLSLPNGVCPSGSLVQVFGKTSSGAQETIISDQNPATRFGAWVLRAECVGSGDAIVVRAARLTSKGGIDSTDDNDFLLTPLTNKKVTWDSDQSYLFPPKKPLCPKTSDEGFPAPDFNSGWIPLVGANTQVVHNLGTRNYIAMLEIKRGSSPSDPIEKFEYYESKAQGNYIDYFATERVLLDEQNANSLYIKKWVNFIKSTRAEPYPEDNPRHPAKQARVKIWRIRS